MKLTEFLKNSESFFNFIDSVVKAEDRRGILDKLVEDIRDYIGADRCSLFIFDKQAGELVSMVAQQREEVRLPVNKRTLTGYTFLTGKNCCVTDAYNENELKKIDPEIRVSGQWDEKSGYKTKCILTTAIVARGKTVGVFMALNKPGGFIAYSVQGALEFSPLLGLAVEIVLLDEALKEGKRLEDLPFDF
jgi:GAF domain-containing protein